MRPETDSPLREMPLSTKNEAIAFVKAYKQWIYENGATGNGAFKRKHSLPATIRAPDLVAKAAAAMELAELNYWQMPYEQAKKVWWGLPLAKWEAERVKQGISESVGIA